MAVHDDLGRQGYAVHQQVIPVAHHIAVSQALGDDQPVLEGHLFPVAHAVEPFQRTVTNKSAGRVRLHDPAGMTPGFPLASEGKLLQAAAEGLPFGVADDRDPPAAHDGLHHGRTEGGQDYHPHPVRALVEQIPVARHPLLALADRERGGGGKRFHHCSRLIRQGRFQGAGAAAGKEQGDDKKQCKDTTEHNQSNSMK